MRSYVLQLTHEAATFGVSSVSSSWNFHFVSWLPKNIPPSAKLTIFISRFVQGQSPSVPRWAIAGTKKP